MKNLQNFEIYIDANGKWFHQGKSIDRVSFEKTFYVHCKGGYRSMIAASILLANGISNFSNIPGGYDKIKNYNS